MISEIFEKEKIIETPVVKLYYQDINDTIPINSNFDIPTRSIVIKEKEIDLLKYKIENESDIMEIIKNWAYKSPVYEIDYTEKSLNDTIFIKTLNSFINRVKHEMFISTRIGPGNLILVGDYDIYLKLDKLPGDVKYCKDLKNDEILIMLVFEGDKTRNSFRYLYNNYLEAFVPLKGAENSTRMIRLLDKRKILFEKLQKIKD